MKPMSWLFLAGMVSLVPAFARAQSRAIEVPQVPAGFRAQLFAMEPMIRNPASMAFDSKGRLFVGQGPQYRHPKPDTPPDSIVILSDTDGDGVADQVKTFATGFNCIQSLAWHGNDLWVANSPDLTIVRDLDGDDEADEYVLVYTDLGNLEHALHGLNWGPDRKLYMSKGNSKGLTRPGRIAPKPFRDLWAVKAPTDAPDFPPIRVFKKGEYQHAYHDPADDWGRQGGILRCDNLGKNLEIVAAGMRNPWDITFDDGFHWLGTDNDQTEGDKIFMPFFGAHFGWGHAWSYHWSGDNHLPTVPASGPLFEGSGTGVVFYQAEHFPASHRGVFYINDWLRKCVYLYRPVWDGALLKPALPAGKLEEFITRGKSLFNPTDIEVGPDGSLYILSWGTAYGATWKNGQQENEGRIFRITYEGNPTIPRSSWNANKRQKPVSDWTFAELADDLGHQVPVWRVNAQEELVRRGAAVRNDLIHLLQKPDLPRHRQTWAAWTLGCISLDDPAIDQHFAKLAGGNDLNLRIQAIRILAHRLRESGKARELPASAIGALKDPEPRIRFEAVLALRQARQRQSRDVLLALAGSETDRVTFYACWQALLEIGGNPDELRPFLADHRPGVQRAVLLALAERTLLKREEVLPFRLVEDADNAAFADLWLSKHGVRPPRLLTIEPAGGDFSDSITVTLQRGIDGAQVHYTVDGTPPSATSPRYGDAIVLKDDATLTAVLIRDGKRIGPTQAARFHRLTEQELRGKLVYGLRAASRNRYELAENGLVLGAQFYTDREYRLTNVPAELAGASFIRTANEDSGARAANFLAFELTRDAAVYIGHDIRTKKEPAWMKVGQAGGFLDTGLVLSTSDHRLRLYRKDFRAGSVALGGNEAISNYLVIIRRPPLVPRARKTEVAEVLPLGATGNAERGRDIFFDADGLQCLRCHRVGTQGQKLAPNLSDIGLRAKPDEIIRSILEPNASITEGFSTHLIETSSGKIFTGSIVAETGRELKLLQADGQIADIERDSIVERVALNRSIMPDNFGLYLDPQQVADLAAFLLSCQDNSAQAAAAPAQVSFEEKPGELLIRLGGQPLASYIYQDPKILRPFLAHVRVGGIQVTRNHPPTAKDSSDHDTMHPGIWLGFGDIAGTDFWRNRGKVEHEKFAQAPTGGKQGTFTVLNRYVNGDKTVCRQTCRYTVAPVPQGTLLIIDSIFSGDANFDFGAQEEMGLGVRVATPLTVKASGRMLDAQGRVNEKEIWGKQADWCDYSGIINGQRIGMMIMPDPGVQKVWFHARDYGVLVANPFGPRAGGPNRKPVKAGDSFRLRFGVLLHASPAQQPVSLTEAYQTFLEQSKQMK